MKMLNPQLLYDFVSCIINESCDVKFVNLFEKCDNGMSNTFLNQFKPIKIEM